MKCQKVRQPGSRRSYGPVRSCMRLWNTRISALKKLRNPPPSAVLIYTTIIRQKTRSFWISWRKIIFPAAGTGSLLQEYCRDGGSSSQAAETDGSPLYHHREELLPGKADGF